MVYSKYIAVFLLALAVKDNCAQFAPPAGQPGTTAMYKDSTAFVDWAVQCTVMRGFMNCTNPPAGYASAGDSSQALGIAGSNAVVSLGDGGSAVCRFSMQVSNGPGYDFAVFENGFDNYFLELAFVEVSSDGINFFRFPATSLTQDTIQVDSFDSLDATKLNNLAGKYRALYGTPFDLQELNGISGLDINAITHIKVVDVIGTLDVNYCSYDQYGNKVNDPWPTEFATGGFDLEAIGIIHNWLNAVSENKDENVIEFYPNPVNDRLFFRTNTNEKITGRIYDAAGTCVRVFEGTNAVDVSMLDKGIYLIYLMCGNSKVTKTFVHN
jgi:hypothetical protein